MESTQNSDAGRKYPICRTCLCIIQQGSFKLHDISLCGDGLRIAHVLKYIVPELYLGLSQQPEICRNCLESMKVAYNFRKLCLETETKIGNYLKSVKCTAQTIDLVSVIKYINNLKVAEQKDICLISDDSCDSISSAKPQNIETEQNTTKQQIIRKYERKLNNTESLKPEQTDKSAETKRISVEKKTEDETLEIPTKISTPKGTHEMKYNPHKKLYTNTLGKKFVIKNNKIYSLHESVKTKTNAGSTQKPRKKLIIENLIRKVPTTKKILIGRVSKAVRNKISEDKLKGVLIDSPGKKLSTQEISTSEEDESIEEKNKHEGQMQKKIESKTLEENLESDKSPDKITEQTKTQNTLGVSPTIKIKEENISDDEYLSELKSNEEELVKKKIIKQEFMEETAEDKSTPKYMPIIEKPTQKKKIAIQKNNTRPLKNIQQSKEATTDIKSKPMRVPQILTVCEETGLMKNKSGEYFNLDGSKIAKEQVDAEKNKAKIRGETLFKISNICTIPEDDVFEEKRGEKNPVSSLMDEPESDMTHLIQKVIKQHETTKSKDVDEKTDQISENSKFSIGTLIGPVDVGNVFDEGACGSNQNLIDQTPFGEKKDEPTILNFTLNKGFFNMSDSVLKMEVEDETDCKPAETLEKADNAINLLPPASKERYENAYSNFLKWLDEKHTTSCTESVLLAYFQELGSKYKPSSLWSMYSMLRSMLVLKQNIDISLHCKLKAYLKQQANGYNAKKAKIFSKEEVETFLGEAPDLTFLLIKTTTRHYEKITPKNIKDFLPRRTVKNILESTNESIPKDNLVEVKEEPLDFEEHHVYQDEDTLSASEEPWQKILNPIDDNDCFNYVDIPEYVKINNVNILTSDSMSSITNNLKPNDSASCSSDNQNKKVLGKVLMKKPISHPTRVWESLPNEFSYNGKTLVKDGNIYKLQKKEKAVIRNQSPLKKRSKVKMVPVCEIKKDKQEKTIKQSIETEIDKDMCILYTSYKPGGYYINDHDYLLSPYIRNNILVREGKLSFCRCFICGEQHRLKDHIKHMSQHSPVCPLCNIMMETSLMLNFHMKSHASTCQKCLDIIPYPLIQVHAEKHRTKEEELVHQKDNIGTQEKKIIKDIQERKDNKETEEEKPTKETKLVIKSCFVTNCKNTNNNSSKIFIPVPKDSYNKWFEAVNRVPLNTEKDVWCCEDHFVMKEDCKNWKQFIANKETIKIKDEVVPHRFINTPSNISKRTTQFNVELKSDENINKQKEINRKKSNNNKADTESEFSEEETDSEWENSKRRKRRKLQNPKPKKVNKFQAMGTRRSPRSEHIIKKSYKSSDSEDEKKINVVKKEKILKKKKRSRIESESDNEKVDKKKVLRSRVKQEKTTEKENDR